MTINYNKNLWCLHDKFKFTVIFHFIFSKPDEATSNAYGTPTSTTTSTESDVNTYNVNNSDVNIPDVNNSDVYISETLALKSLPWSADVESTRK